MSKTKKSTSASKEPVVEIAKPHSLFQKNRFSKTQLVIFAIVFALLGGLIIWKSFAVSTFTPADLHVHRLEVDPNSYDVSSGAGNNYQFVWGKFQSPTTDGGAEREFIWTSGHKYVNRSAWVLWSWKPVQGRQPGRVLNFHTDPNQGGWEPDNSYGVSALALDWFGDQLPDGQPAGLSLSLENYGWQQGNPGRKHYTIIPVSVMDDALKNGKWLDITMQINFDLYPNGGVKVWVNGNDTPVVDVKAGTIWPSQTGTLLWEGMYNSSGTNQTNIGEFMPARVGRTLDEALNDNSIREVDILGSYYKSTNQPAYRHTTIGTRNTSLFRLPPSLGGSSSPSPSPNPAPTPSPTPPIPSPTATLTSSINNGATVVNGATWTASVSPTPASVEFWANGSKLATDTSAPYSTVINLPTGSNQLGLCYTINSVRTCGGTGGIFATVTVATPAPTPTTPTPTPPVPPSPTTTTITSSINNGATVANGTTWTASFGAAVSSVEFWANGSKLATDTSAPYSTVINLPIGSNQLGLCYTLNSARTCGGTGGIFATITVSTPPTPVPTPLPPPVTPPPVITLDRTKPSTPTNFRVTSATKTSVSLAWNASTDNVKVAGYTLNRSLQQIYDGPKVSVTNYDLSPGSSYVYYINAYDSAGNLSSPSKRVCVAKYNWWSKVTKSRGWGYC